MEKVQQLKGMADRTGDSWVRFQRVQEDLRAFLRSYGYSVIDTPVLEATELFMRKSGGELASRMYTFRDPGGNLVSLRPEFTSSIMRHYLVGETNQVPLRVQYCGPVFRYETNLSQGGYYQFTQLGAELLGSSSALADAEVLSTACLCLSELGIKGYTLELGDLSVLNGLLEELGLSERAILFILSSISELKEGADGLAQTRQRAQQLGFLAGVSDHEYLRTAVRGMASQEARQLLLGVLEWADPDGSGLGQRKPQEVVERLARKLQDEDAPERLERGLELASQLAQVRGKPANTLKEAEELIHSFGLDSTALQGPRRIVELLGHDQLQDLPIVLDLGLARGIAYYTGIVFEVVHSSTHRTLGGGGRYDGLARALGSNKDVPTLGFAINLEMVSTTLADVDGGRLGEGVVEESVLVVADDDGYGEALQVARKLRGEGLVVEMEVYHRGIQESLVYAKDRGIGRIVKVDSSGTVTEQRIWN